jgi:hypothetical protein
LQNTSLQAERWEARCLTEFDYAWNTKLNPPKREVKLVHRDCCCFAVGVDVISVSRDKDGASLSKNTISLLADPLKRSAKGIASTAVILQVLCAITAVCIVAEQLSVEATGQPGDVQLTSQCLLGVSSQGSSLCTYTYILAGSSMVFSLLLGVIIVRTV